MADEWKLPIFKTPLPDPKSLDMDTYLGFVLANLELIPDRKALEEIKKKERVNVRFVID